MSRFAREQSVFVWEEAIACDHHRPFLEHHPFPEQNVVALRPRLPHWWDEAAKQKALAALLDGLIASVAGSISPVLWFYTPAMFGFARHVEAAAVIYDCMDELSAFRFAPPELKALEAELMDRADAVFTGGWSLYEAKRDRHDNIHPFPSSVDGAHFAQARGGALPEPDDQAAIPHPRLGFYGVIDERMDLGLLAAVAAARPDWHIVMVGPVVKLNPAELPHASNIHYLGGKTYEALPGYLAGWDVALLPFAINAATRFISPTKTPEYLAAGRPVVSTPVTDVVRHYGTLPGVSIADTAERFVAACAAALALKPDDWRPQADAALATQSWDDTFGRMRALVDAAVERGRPAPEPRRSAEVMHPAIRPAGRRKPFDVLVAGAGFAGAVLAERLAVGSNARVLVVDRRPHIAGNAFDHHDKAGILVHRYGPHIFHTNSREVFDHLSNFTAWRPYEHRVLAAVRGLQVPMPINRTTLNQLFGLDLADDAAAAAFLAGRAEPVAEVRTAADVVISAVGRELYELFFRGYTRKQWGLDPSELDRSVTQRVPTRTTTDDRYFTDTYQAMPANGYTAMFERMLDHPNIVVETGTEFDDAARDVVVDHTVFTGPVDAFFDHRFGPLPYRSLEFRHESHARRRFQPVGVVNYPSEDVPYTRITEYKHLTGQVSPSTSITYEVPSATGDPYYPIPRPENQALYKRYEALALARRDVSFVGRLATYRYYNMDQVVGQALATYRRLVERGIVSGAAATAADSSSAAALA
ncbi:UDP-galactopyranose mutase [Lichenihabitans sp. Uapishka_5]|uniref:UDP-galactopyranose mutase n=1 Tax=Lichenihabitans sp. Uapishka_5 TaxID=3037302 RepID=UPI0029E7D499|nr:UDP-galactopyranose mutase [Lichenihabitans sp. Uapishka_5]MDX7951662.1 UDP-galactopyranose mutase [Lichenihabitans sp. Uapishka_5]